MVLKMNLTISQNISDKLGFIPDQDCFNWCAVQQVTHSNNMEIYAVMILVFTYLMIVLYQLSDDFEKLRPFRENFLNLAKLSLVAFFGFYFLIIRLRLIW